MSKTWMGVLIVVGSAALVPFGLIALSRVRPSAEPPVHLILDMDKQPKFRTQRENMMFADGRAMRPVLPGVVAREDLVVPNEVLNDPEFPRWVDGRAEPFVPQDAAAWERLTRGAESAAGGDVRVVTRLPVPVSMDLMRRGRERYNVFCAPCHGTGGYGDGMVARRAAEMQAAGADSAANWVTPTNYHTDELRSRPVGHLFNTVTHGIRSMAAYGKQIPVADRWAIVAYVKALQRSQHATGAEDVPPLEREKNLK
ncbi:MAG: cytochrome c [Candidatus Anammoximicrobium sp.]|nr:cytochrome c [Candidatus Anammoximicrobium sp.]